MPKKKKGAKKGAKEKKLKTESSSNIFFKEK